MLNGLHESFNNFKTYSLQQRSGILNKRPKAFRLKLRFLLEGLTILFLYLFIGTYSALFLFIAIVVTSLALKSSKKDKFCPITKKLGVWTNGEKTSWFHGWFSKFNVT